MDSSALSIRADSHRKNGLTLIELLVVFSLITVLSASAYTLLSNLQYRTDTQTTVDRLLADIKSQRLKAVLGASGFSATGVYFAQNKPAYVIFSCDDGATSCVYSETLRDRKEELLPSEISFSEVTLAGSQVLFMPRSGEVVDYVDDNDSLVIRNVADRTRKRITFGRIMELQIETLSKL